MPPFALDFTINLPLIIALGGALWLGQKRLTTMENRIAANQEINELLNAGLKTQIEDHTKSEEARMSSMESKVSGIEGQLRTGVQSFERLAVADAEIKGRVGALEGKSKC